MKFLYLAYCEKNVIHPEQVIVSKVHQAPIEHAIVQWIRQHLTVCREINSVEYVKFSKEQVENFYAILHKAHAEQTSETSRPWKYLPIPSQENYPYKIAEYEKEYGPIYYESLYKYITALEIILNLFDFEQHQLLVSIR